MAERRRHRIRLRGQRGASAVELAIVAPLLLMLALGAAEIGIAWRNVTSVVQASATGARTVSQIGVDEEADRLALRSIRAGFDADWPGIRRVVIYEATAGSGGMPPAACIATGVTTGPAGSNCNVYDNNDLSRVDNPNWFDNGADCGGAASANWCPSARDDSVRSAQWVGVWIEYESQWISGALPFVGPYEIVQHTVMRVEPTL